MRDSVPRLRHVRRRSERRLLLPLPRPSAAGGGSAHAHAANLVWRRGRPDQHDSHSLRRGAGAARVGAGHQSEHAQLHRRPGEHGRGRCGVERDHAQRRLRAVCTPGSHVWRVLRPWQRQRLHKRPDVDRRRRQLLGGGQLRLDRCHLRRWLRAFRPHDDRLRRRHHRVSFGRQRHHQLRPVRGRRGRAARASAFIDASPRPQRRSGRHRDAAGHRRLGLLRRSRLLQHRGRRRHVGNGPGAGADEGRGRVLALQAKLLRLPHLGQRRRRHHDQADQRGERGADALHHRIAACGKHRGHPAGGDDQLVDHAQQVRRTRRLDVGR